MTGNADDVIDEMDSDPDIDKSREEIEDQVEQKLDDMLGNQESEMSEEQVRYHAAVVVKNNLKGLSGGGGGFGGGETEEIPILTLGYRRREGDYFVTDGDALQASGIINPPDDPAGYAVFIIDEAHGVDLEHAADAFQPLNTVRGYASKRQVGQRDGEPTIKKGGNPTYLVNSTDDSKFEVVDPDSVDDSDPLSGLPSDREAKRDLIHENFVTDEEQFTIETYADHESTQNSNGWEVAFGADVKRIRGEVIDAVKFDSGDGMMTVTDGTVYSDEDVPEELIGDSQRTPGLQVSTASDLIFGEDSVLDLYGHVIQKQDGQYRMNALGVIPVIGMEYDGPEGVGGSDDSEHEEGTI